MTDFECENMDMALTALDTIAAGMKGAQQAALLAVKTWVQKNVPTGFSHEELSRIFNEKTEAQRKGEAWFNRGSRKVGDEWVSTEPLDGAEWLCVWNAECKRWEPPFPPPLTTAPYAPAQNSPQDERGVYGVCSRKR